MRPEAYPRFLAGGRGAPWVFQSAISLPKGPHCFFWAVFVARFGGFGACFRRCSGTLPLLQMASQASLGVSNAQYRLVAIQPMALAGGTQPPRVCARLAASQCLSHTGHGGWGLVLPNPPPSVAKRGRRSSGLT